MFTIKETNNGQFYVQRYGVVFSPYFHLESDAALFLHRVKYNRGCDTAAVLMSDESWKQANRLSAALPTLASPEGGFTVARMVMNRINCKINATRRGEVLTMREVY